MILSVNVLVEELLINDVLGRFNTKNFINNKISYISMETEKMKKFEIEVNDDLYKELKIAAEKANMTIEEYIPWVLFEIDVADMG